MADAAPKKGFGLFKAAIGGGIGLATGVIGAYATAIVDMVAKPPQPVANFAVSADGLKVTCQNHASGQTGWWDFGDGTPLEPFNADQKEVEHTYVKAGSYSIKLVVRNFLNAENDRSVPVDVAVASATAPGGGPTIANLSVEPVGARTAPATFRVRCELKNAQQTILDLGSGERPEVLTASGVIDKYVVYEHPGAFPLQLYAVSGAKLDKQWSRVDVKAAAAGTLSAVLRVSDSGTRAERKTTAVTVPVAVPAKPTGGFERVVPAEPGFAVAEVKLGAVASKAVKNVKAEPTPDKKAVKVTGEWTGTADATNKAAGGSDPMLPLQLVQERTTAFTAPPQTVAAPLGFAGSFFDSDKPQDWNTAVRTVSLQMPPAPAGAAGVQRKMTLELREANPQGQDVLVLTVPDLSKASDEQAVTLSNKQPHVVRWERLPTGQLKVSVRGVQRVAGR